MGLVDLIKEIPQAAVLREHLALADRQLADLATKNVELTARLIDLEAENEQLRNENQALKKIHDESSETLVEIEEKILTCLTNPLTITRTAVQRELQLSATRAAYHLEHLEGLGYVHKLLPPTHTYAAAGPRTSPPVPRSIEPTYMLEQKGRDYLIRLVLIE